MVCDAASFSSARAHEDIEGVFSTFPLKDEASSVKVSDNIIALQLDSSVHLVSFQFRAGGAREEAGGLSTNTGELKQRLPAQLTPCIPYTMWCALLTD